MKALGLVVSDLCNIPVEFGKNPISGFRGEVV